MSETSSRDAVPTLDHSVLDPLCEVLEESAHEVFDEFLSDTPRLAEETRAALDSADYHKVARLVHQLKSSSGALGGKRVQKLSSEVETLVKTGDETATKQTCENLFSAIDELLLALAEYRQKFMD